MLWEMLLLDRICMSDCLCRVSCRISQRPEKPVEARGCSFLYEVVHELGVRGWVECAAVV